MPDQLVTTAISLLVGYVCGNFLTADVVSKRLAHKSVFELGVGNPGMANVGHELGTKAAIAVLAGDILKTILAWALAQAAFPADAPLVGLLAGLGCTLGHNYPIWHHFRGGKGVTTTCAAIILASPITGTVSCLIGLGGVLVSGYLCYGAITITVAYWLATSFMFGVLSPQAIVALLLALLMTKAHWSAVQAARAGTQRRASIAVKLRRKLGLPTR